MDAPRFTPVAKGGAILAGRAAAKTGLSPIAGFRGLEELRGSYIVDFLRVGERLIPRVSTDLSKKDRIDGTRARWGFGRMEYRVLSGLYCAGNPSPASPVLVSANYKLSFDALRKELRLIDAWILVLDTKGINVWCAAGKGTFGTGELIEKIRRLKLSEIVSHASLVLPQLGAPGVEAPIVKRETGFRVIWGPVRARDIKEFMTAGMKKTARMREVDFNLADRLAVAPIELFHAWKAGLILLAASLLLALPAGSGYAGRALSFLLAGGGALVAGALAFPALLPLLPFRAFALKGTVLGLAWGAVAALIAGMGFLGSAGIVLSAAPIVAFIAMNFTGSSTFTCQEGAKLEVLWGTIPMAVSLIFGLGLLIAEKFI